MTRGVINYIVSEVNFVSFIFGLLHQGPNQYTKNWMNFYWALITQKLSMTYGKNLYFFYLYTSAIQPLPKV